MKEKLAFLGSVRFWKAGIMATLIVLVQQGLITNDLAQLVAELFSIWLGVDISINTIDRFSVKK